MNLWGCESAGSRRFHLDLNGADAENAKDEVLPETVQA